MGSDSTPRDKIGSRQVNRHWDYSLAPTMHQDLRVQNGVTTRKTILGSRLNDRLPMRDGEHFLEKIKSKVRILTRKWGPRSDHWGVQNAKTHLGSVPTMHRPLSFVKHHPGSSEWPNLLAIRPFPRSDLKSANTWFLYQSNMGSLIGNSVRIPPTRLTQKYWF